jgi:CheY-like chemotaxis protein/HPt (histidine-containing phosphotransfer) domain-containing protein
MVSGMVDASISNASDGRGKAVAVDHDDIIERLKAEFLDFAADALDELDTLITAGRDPDGDHENIIDAVRRGCHNLKGMGGSFGYPLITLLSHRMEDYFAGRDRLNNRTLLDGQFFLDRMREVLEGRFDGIAEADVVRTLPAKTNFEVEDIVKQDIEVLLIMPRNTATKIIETELQACGYRVVTETEPFSAIETAIRTCPNLILAAGVMEDLSGIDLACALHAMPISRDLPFVLVTSLEPSRPSFAALPPTVPVVRKGDTFGDDLAIALAILEIT